jgi:hypothetical protein
MTVKQEGKNLVITLPMKKEISKSGKSIVIASSNGNKPTDIQIDGKILTIGVNAYISKS